MTTELVLLGTAGGPMPVAGRAGILSAVVESFARSCSITTCPRTHWLNRVTNGVRSRAAGLVVMSLPHTTAFVFRCPHEI